MFKAIFLKFFFSGIGAFADRHNCGDLVTMSESFARHHFIEVVQGEEFMEISAQQLTRLLSDDDLNIQSEERVFEAALAWIKFDSDVRQVCYAILLFTKQHIFQIPAFSSTM